MVRHRKDYRVAAKPVSLVATPGSLTVNFLNERGELTRCFDFSVYTSRPVLAAELALAFRQHHATSAAATSAGAFRSASIWFLFLDDYQAEIVAMRQVDGEAVRAFIAWLDRNIYGKGNRYLAWSGLKQLFVWLLRNRPELTHPALDIPFNPFPRKNAESQPRAALEQAEIEAVLAAARSDIETSWATFSEGRRALAAVDRAAVAAEPDLKRLDLNDLGTFLAVVIDRFAGIIPSHRDIYAQKLWPFLYALQHHGYTHRVAQYLYPVPETLIPYMIAIGAQTYANAEALRHLRRDCMSEHMLLDGRVVVSWRKGRATREQRRSFLRDRSLSVPNLIDRVLEMTARLVPHVSASEHERLFLYAGIQGATREIKLVPDYLVSSHVRRFVERHNLRDSSGGQLRLTMACLRPTGLTLAHASLGHDIFKTQALANHATPDTTQRYVDRPIVRKAQAAALGRLQLCFVDAVRSGEADHVRETITGIDAEHATASGFLCRDPLSGIGENQKPGRLCTAWLGCFTCPNAVIPLEQDILARLLRTREALVNARAGMDADRWRLLYAPKLEIIDRDIVPRFPQALQEAAMARVDVMPPCPPIE
jgi:integrase